MCQLHKLFDEIAAGLVEFIDTVAERVTALGGEALGTVRMAAAALSNRGIPAEGIRRPVVVDAPG